MSSSAEHPEIGAVVLECNNMVPVRPRAPAAPADAVYDIYSFVTWFHAGLNRGGFGLPRRSAVGASKERPRTVDRASHAADTPWKPKAPSASSSSPNHLADRFKDAILPPGVATPVMIMVMENAALNAIRAYLDPGESAVGTAVNVRHIAATPVGRLVTGEAEVTKVDGRQIEFTVRATEGAKVIGAGSLDVAKFTRRLE